VPLSEPAVELLRRMKEAAATGFLFPGPTRTGHMMELRATWTVVCARAGFEGVRIHDLRHSDASVLASAGMSLPLIGALLGHTQAQTTARYGHLLDGVLRAATERVGAVVNEATGRNSVVDPVLPSYAARSKSN
jgi:integrase